MLGLVVARGGRSQRPVLAIAKIILARAAIDFSTAAAGFSTRAIQ